jgi:hypothetical protein
VSLKGTFNEAWESCNSIGLSLLALDSFQKNRCFTNMTNSMVSVTYRKCMYNIHSIENAFRISDGDYWTSGTDAECPDNYFWCSKDSKFTASQIAWQTGHPSASEGDCVHVQVKNGSQNGTVLGTSNCNEKKLYVCEIRQKGTEGRALAVECMSLWDVTEGFY